MHTIVSCKHFERFQIFKKYILQFNILRNCLILYQFIGKKIGIVTNWLNVYELITVIKQIYNNIYHIIV